MVGEPFKWQKKKTRVFNALGNGIDLQLSRQGAGLDKVGENPVVLGEMATDRRLFLQDDDIQPDIIEPSRGSKSGRTCSDHDDGSGTF